MWRAGFSRTRDSPKTVWNGAHTVIRSRVVGWIRFATFEVETCWGCEELTVDVNAWLTNLVKSFEVLVNTVETRPYGIDVWYRIVPRRRGCDVLVATPGRLTDMFESQSSGAKQFANNLETKETGEQWQQWLWWAFWTNMTSVTHMGHIHQFHLKYCKDTFKSCTLNLSTHTFDVILRWHHGNDL